jgi:hypothetical protein
MPKGSSPIIRSIYFIYLLDLGKVKNENLSKKMPNLSRIHIGRALPEVWVENGRAHTSTLFT